MAAHPSSARVQLLLRAVLLLTTASLACAPAAADAESNVLAGDWAPNGVLVAPGPGEALSAFPVPDESGGFFLVWVTRSAEASSSEVRATRVFSSATTDPRWPAEGVLLGPNDGTIQAWRDHSGGLVVAVGLRVSRLSAAGAPLSGWPAGGRDVVPASSSSLFAVGIDQSDDVWSFGIAESSSCVYLPGHPSVCVAWLSIHAIRVTPAGQFRPGWEPPGRLLVQDGDQGDLATKFVAAIPGGVAVVFRHRIGPGPNYYDLYELLHVMDSGSVVREPVQEDRSGFNSHDRVRWDVDASGAAYINTGQGYFWPSVEKHTPLRQWPWPGWKYPGTYPYGEEVRVIRDDAGGVYLHSVLDRPNGIAGIHHYVNHVLPNGTADPRWPYSGVELPPAAGDLQAYASTRDARGGYFGVYPQGNGTDLDIRALWLLPDATAQPGWDPAGTAVCLVPGSDQFSPMAAPDEMANMFVTWLDRRNGRAQVFAQKIAYDSPVPVEVSSATAEVSGDAVLLTWRIREPEELVAERSADEFEWESLGEIRPGADEGLWYSFDREPVRGVCIHYRLRNRSSDWTGGTVSIVVPAITAVPEVTITPNPVQAAPRIRFAVPARTDHELVVTDVQGREVARRRLPSSSSSSGDFIWDELGRLQSGLYWLQLHLADGAIRSTRFVVVH